jgi:hypothetical protein
MTVDLAIRPFLRRILGYSNAATIAVDRAERSLQLAASRYATLVLCGEGDLVPIAAALHRRTLGPDAPFILCDPRRGNTAANVRSAANRVTCIDAITAAAGGTMCMRARHLPRDFVSVVERLRAATAHVQTMLCWGERDDNNPLLLAPPPIIVPPLRDRAEELPEIVNDYAIDAISTLLAPAHCFTAAHRTWILEHGSGSLSEIEKATLRLVGALRCTRHERGRRAAQHGTGFAGSLARPPDVSPQTSSSYLMPADRDAARLAAVALRHPKLKQPRSEDRTTTPLLAPPRPTQRLPTTPARVHPFAPS